MPAFDLARLDSSKRRVRPSSSRAAPRAISIADSNKPHCWDVVGVVGGACFYRPKLPNSFASARIAACVAR